MSGSWKIFGVLLLVVLCPETMVAVASQEPDRGGQPEELDRTPVLPQVEPTLADRRLEQVNRVRVNRIELVGNTIFTEAELADLFKDYQGQEISVEQLQELRHKLSQECFDRGYVNSGVVIPDQDVVDGPVKLQLVAGTLARINVTGNQHLSSKYLARRIQTTIHDPLHIGELEQALRLLEENPRIQQVNGQLVPGMLPGEGYLELAIRETRAMHLVIDADNHRSPSIGGEELTLSFTHMNLTGHGDDLQLAFSRAGGFGNTALAYSIPITPRDTSFYAFYRQGDSDIVEEPFDQIDIESKTRSYGVSVLHPFLKEPGRVLVGSFGIETRHSESTLLGVPFSFSAGDREGKSNTTALYAGVEWTSRSLNQVLALRGIMRRGLESLGATINEQGPDGEFTSFFGQFQYARSLDTRGDELLVRSTAQWAASPLLSIEKLPVGGFNSVRGYRENQFVRDNGILASVEFRIPIRPQRPVSRLFQPANLRFAPFLDFGRSWDADGLLSTPGSKQIYSIGLGLLWNPIPGLSMDLYWGHPFEDAGNPDNDLQDDGIHFHVGYSIPF